MKIRNLSLIFLFKTLILVFLFHSNLFSFAFEDLAMAEGFGKGYAITSHQSLDALSKNPASFSGAFSHTFLQSTYATSYDTDVNTFSMTGLYPLSSQTNIFFNLPILKINNIPLTEELNGKGVQTSSFTDFTTGPMLGCNYNLGTELDIHTLGFSLSGLVRQIHTTSGYGWGLNLGYLKSFEYFDVGASIQNIIGSKMTWSSGYAENRSKQLNIGINLKYKQFKYLTDVEFNLSKHQSKLNVSPEIKLSPSFTGTIGIRDVFGDRKTRLGLKLAIQRVTVNYAFQSVENLGNAHRLGVSCVF